MRSQGERVDFAGVGAGMGVNNDGNVAGRACVRYVRGEIAGVAELADAQVLGACGEIRVGSSPSARISLWGCGCGSGWWIFRIAVRQIFGIFKVSQRKRA